MMCRKFSVVSLSVIKYILMLVKALAHSDASCYGPVKVMVCCARLNVIRKHSLF